MPNEYIYAKILYINNKEIVKLRNVLQIFGYKGKFVKKKQLESIGILQTTNTFIIYAKKDKVGMDLKTLCSTLKEFEFLQILGIIKNNILLQNNKITENYNVINILKILQIFIFFKWKRFVSIK